LLDTAGALYGCKVK